MKYTRINLTDIFKSICRRSKIILQREQVDLLLFQWRLAKFKEISMENILVQATMPWEKIYYYF